jgi:outer membrane protein OmpA-like peptidoglycan-associated protein/TolB-like protein
MKRYAAIFVTSVAVILTFSATVSAETLNQYTLLPPNHFTSVSCIAILPLENNTADPEAASAFSEALATELYKTERFGVIERSEVVNSLAGMGAKIPKKMSGEVAAVLGGLLKADAVITGSVTEYGYRTVDLKNSVRVPSLGVSMRLIDVRSNKVLWAASMSSSAGFFSASTTLFLLALEAAEELFEPIIESLPDRYGAPPVCGRGRRRPAAPPQVAATVPPPRPVIPTPPLVAPPVQPPPVAPPRKVKLANKAQRDLFEMIKKGGTFSLPGITFKKSTPNYTVSSLAGLDNLAAVMRAYPQIKVKIIGNADSEEAPGTATDLSRKRAEAVRKYLVDRKGVNSSRFEVVAAADGNPLLPNISLRGRKMNRRVELNVVGGP